MSAATLESRVSTAVRQWLLSQIGNARVERLTRFYYGARTMGYLARHVIPRGLPTQVLYYGWAPGDSLLSTVVAHELSRRKSGRTWVRTRHPAIFDHSPDVDCVTSVDAKHRPLIDLLGFRYQNLSYGDHDKVTDRTPSPKEHILITLCRQVGITGPIELKPRIYLTPGEIEAGRWAQDHLVMQSSGMAAWMPMRNKQWIPERYDEVARNLPAGLKLAQIGSPEDPPLTGAVDLRGKTTLRQSAAILYNARLYLGTVGMPMHLARAADCPAVIIYGGREAPWQSGYSGNANIYSAVPCAPCWLWNRCDFGHTCMEMISSRDVLNHIDLMLARPRGDLAMDRFTI